MLGDNLLALIKAYNYRGIPMPLLKRLTYQVCQSLPLYNTLKG